jgi:PAS domain S-box-containing protein
MRDAGGERHTLGELLADAPVRLDEVLDQLPATVGVFTGPDLVVRYANPLYAALAGRRAMIGRPVAEVFPEPENQRVVEALHRAYETGETISGQQWSGVAADPATGDTRTLYFDFTYVPLRTPEGDVVGALVHAMEVTRLVEAREDAEDAERRLRLLSAGGVVGVVTASRSRIEEANDTFLAIVGRTREELEAGRLDWATLTPPDWRAATEAALREIEETGRVGPFEKEYVRPDGTRAAVIVGSVRLEREPLRLMSFVIDQTARRVAERERERLLVRERQARQEAEVTVERLGRLQRATAALSAALSPTEVGDATVTQALESLRADAGTLGLRDGNEVVLVHDRGYTDEDATQWRRFPMDHPNPLVDSILDRQPIWLECHDDFAPWPDLHASVHRFDSLAVVPLVVAGRALGAIALSFRRPRVLTAGERAFLLAVADLAAQALDRARLYEERAYVARTLQTGLLPERVDEAAGLEVAVRYHSIADGGEVGGDFYDFFAIGDDRWLVAVGDVAGKGSAAAVLTGLARHTLRAIATREEHPSAMLAFLNEALRRQSTDAAFCTVGCAVLERTAAGFTAHVSSGGHPYPLLARAGAGRAEEVVVRGTLLGVERDPELEDVRVELGPGDLLVLRTDGVEDARGPDGERFGEERVADAVSAAAGGSAEEVAGAVDAAVAAHERGEPRRDDRAIVVLRVGPTLSR